MRTMIQETNDKEVMQQYKALIKMLKKKIKMEKQIVNEKKN